MRAPIWTTWARYKTNVTQAKVLRYAQEIVERNLPRSVLEVDDRWQVSPAPRRYSLQLCHVVLGKACT